MDLTDKHPFELDFYQIIKEVKNLLENCEHHFLDGDEREFLKIELKTINEKLFNLQMERISQYINVKGRIENLPKEEEDLQREMTELTIRINKIINTD
jgi:hypothetical protein